MKRQIFTTNFGEFLVRNTVRLEVDEGATEGSEGFRALMGLWQTIMWDPNLLRHGGDCPETVKYFIENGKWICEAVTVIPRG